MTKIVIVGAGSHVFSRRLITDCLTWPALQDATIGLMDIYQDRVDLMAALAKRMVTQQGVGAQIEGTTDLKRALDGADYVFTTIRVGEGRNFVDIPAKYGVSHTVG
ncbi:MAG: alpha-glucosidase/alpha-galactosidase, partial [Chloroflexota bacterium]